MRRYGRTPKLSSLADSTLNHILPPSPFFLLPLTSLILSYPLITLIKRKYTKNFFPFSLNPRNCIGMKFATNEAIMLIASIVQNFDLRIFSSSSPPLHPLPLHHLSTSPPLPILFVLIQRIELGKEKVTSAFEGTLGPRNLKCQFVPRVKA